MLGAFIHGMILAFGLILPLGAQNVFVFNQGASQRHFKGAVPVILTASLCDTLLILLAVWGVSVIVLTIPVLQSLLFAIGMLFLLYMGWSVWYSAPASFLGGTKAMPPRKQIMFALSVSLLNPHAILDTIGVIGTSSLNYTGTDRVIFTVSCIAISWLWFLCLALAGKVAGRFDTTGRFLMLINKASALIIWGVAVYLAVQLIQMI
ncbi:MAG TPA: LysE/ArgO family amino acid transporter [Bacillaceae bacterium]